MRAAIAPGDMHEEEVLDRVLAHPKMEGLELACGVSTDRRYVISAVGREEYHVAAFDFGVKASSPRLLSERGCRVTVLPSEADTADVLALEPDGLFLSNGPGDPAAVERVAGDDSRGSRQGDPRFRDLPGTPTHRQGLRRGDLQAALRPPRREPSGHEPRTQNGRDHLPESRLCGNGRGSGRSARRARSQSHAQQPLRRYSGGRPPL